MNPSTVYLKPLRRTFSAKGQTDELRLALNRDALTSEYAPSQRYLVRVPGDTVRTFATKEEAEAFCNKSHE